ncbi:MAG: hypothetical protein Q4B68_03275 [Bacteroidales bacterium]|nr:hypothetical protein [Bacteroidales bacterium]
MKYKFLLPVLLAPFMGAAQNAYDYYGDKVQLEAHYFQSRNAGKLQGDKKQAYQGMDISNGGLLVSAQATGVVTVYDVKNTDLDKEKQFKLSSYAKTANAYNLALSTQKWADDDALPLLYVSGNGGVLAVERVDKKYKNVKTVQSITITDVKADKIYWTLDGDNAFLYAVAVAKSGTHQVLRFALPEVGENAPAEVKLSAKDALDSHIIENFYQGASLASAHGVSVHNGMLYITAGSAKEPSRLYVWDLYGKMMRNVIDLSAATRGELAACSVWNGALWVQTQEGVYKLIF